METVPSREDSFRVHEVISPSRLLLDNGLSIRLLGIKEIPEKSGDAIEFLEKTIKGNRGFSGGMKICKRVCSFLYTYT